MESADAPYRLEWTPELVAKFWNYWAGRTDHDSWYFSFQLGAAVVRLAELAGVLRGKILDYGCGPGFLLDHLAARGLESRGVDFSAISVGRANARLAGKPGWGGALLATQTPTPLEGGCFDVIFCVEVVEHLLEPWLAPTFGELHRLARPGGAVFISTPMNEDLTQLEAYCPSCGCVYHRVQHVRSWTPAALAGALREAGFDVLFCGGIDLNGVKDDFAFPGPADLSFRRVDQWLRRLGRRAGDRLMTRERCRGFEFGRATAKYGPHLCAIGVKR